MMVEQSEWLTFEPSELIFGQPYSHSQADARGAPSHKNSPCPHGSLTSDLRPYGDPGCSNNMVNREIKMKQHYVIIVFLVSSFLLMGFYPNDQCMQMSESFKMPGLYALMCSDLIFCILECLSAYNSKLSDWYERPNMHT